MNRSNEEQLYCEICDSPAQVDDLCLECHLDAHPWERPDFDPFQEYHSDDDPRYTS